MKKTTNSRLLTLAATAGILACGGLCLSGPTPARSLEETLLEDVQPKRLPSAASQGVGGRDHNRESHFAPSRLTRRSFWAEDLGLAGMSEDESPLVAAAERMREVQIMLGQGKCDAATQQTQRQILDNLDLLLEQVGSCRGSSQQSSTAKKDQSATSNTTCHKSGNGQKSSDKQGSSPDNSGKADSTSDRQPGGTMRPIMDIDQRRAILKRLWGELPARQREEMLQLPVEEFLPSYELLIEEYFRTLSKKRNKP